MSEWVTNTRIGKISVRMEPLIQVIEQVYQSADKLEGIYEAKLERTRKRLSKEKRNFV